MTIRLNGSTSGYTEIDAPAVAGNNNLKLPGGNGSDGNILGTDGAGNLSWVNGRMVLETAKTATGTAVDFTEIPSWVKKITLIFQGVSVSSTNVARVRLGDSGGIETSGYLASGSTIGTSSSASTAYTDGFGIRGLAGVDTFSGHMVLTLISGDTWIASGCFGIESGSASTAFVGGSKATSTALDRVQVTINGTDTFDAGTINLLLEG